MAAMGSLRTADCFFNRRYIFSGTRMPILTLEILTGLFTSFPLTSFMTNLLTAFFPGLFGDAVGFADIFFTIYSTCYVVDLPGGLNLEIRTANKKAH